jgi:hypothetical protein
MPTTTVVDTVDNFQLFPKQPMAVMLVWPARGRGDFSGQREHSGCCEERRDGQGRAEIRRNED